MLSLERRLVRIGISISLGFNLLFNTQVINADDSTKNRAEAYYQYILSRKHHIKLLEVLQDKTFDEDLKNKIKDIILRDYRYLLELDKNSPSLLTEFGITLMDFERYDEAEYNLRRALDLDKDNERAYMELINLYHITKQPDKIEALEAGYGYIFIKDEN